VTLQRDGKECIQKIFPLRVVDFIGAKWRLALTRPYALHSILLGLVLFFFAISFMFSCARIAETYPITPRLDDTVLSWLPVVDVNAISTYGIELFIWTFYGVTLLFFPERFAFGIKTFAIFKLVRGVCLVLTHLGPPFHMIEDGYPGSTFGGMFFTKDLFFSGHTGYPLMAALVYWDIKWLRHIGIVAGLFLGFTTLLMHDHYTIDVVAAIMAAPLVYFVSRWLFESDYLAAVDPYRPGRPWRWHDAETATEKKS
jgi:hypothetical protein